jgi:predicted SnoaL-like aldol condensation-catalyzing enzyme
MTRLAGLALALGALTLGACDDGAGAPTDSASPASEHAAQTEATRKLAHEFLQAYFIDRDLGAYAKFAKPDFIQHNPLMDDGVAAHRTYMDKIFGAARPTPAPPPQAHVIDLVLVDGDLFSVMHHAVNADGTGRLFVDLWRVEDGKIAEHWDVIQDMPLDSAMPHRNGMGCGFQTYDAAKARPDSVTGPACGTPDPKVTREQSLANYKAYVDEVGKGDVVSAIETWFHPAYKQHSPIIADGKQGAIDYLMAEWGKKDAPKPILGEQRIVAEGDFVLVHYMYRLEGVPGEEAHIDVFRFKDGKISEHWDVKQEVPATSANGRGMW